MSKASTKTTRKTLSVEIPSHSLESQSLSPSVSPSFKTTNKKRKRGSERDPLVLLVKKLENSHLPNLNRYRRSSRLTGDLLSIDLKSPINKGKDNKGKDIPRRLTNDHEDDEDGHHESLSHIPLIRLLQLLDMAIKCEPSGLVYDSPDSVVTSAIQHLSKLANLPDVESRYRFRTHNVLHSNYTVDTLIGDEPLCTLIPLLVYFIGAKGLDRLSDKMVTQLRELFIKRLKNIALKPHLKKRRIFTGKKGFHMRDWTIYPNADYEENDSLYDKELVKKGHKFFLREYDDHSDYCEEE